MVERSGMARARPAAGDPRADPLGYWLDQENTAWPVPDPVDGRDDGRGDGNDDRNRGSNRTGADRGADPAALAGAGGADGLPAGWWILPALALSLPAWAVIGWLAFG